MKKRAPFGGFGLRSGLFAPLLLALVFGVAGCKDDSGDGKDDRLIESVKIPPSSSIWLSPIGANDQVTQLVFAGSELLYVDGIRRSDFTYYEFAGIRAIADSPYIWWFTGVWALEGKAPVVNLPPSHGIAGAFPGDEYHFKLTNVSSAENEVDIYKVTKNDDNLSGGAFDLNLFVYTHGEPNDVIPDETEARRLVDFMNQIFGQVGVWVGSLNVAFVDDPNAIADVLDDAGMLSFLERASRETKGRKDRGINCFLFPRLSGDTLGLDGAIPGPAGVHGVASAGIIATATQVGFAAGGLTHHETDLMILAKILTHEIGHYFGLFHTTEYEGSAIEAVTDTPRCPPANDANGDGFLVGPECRGKGAEYLMFWTFDSGLVRAGDFQIRMSSQEGQVANTHPSVN